MLKKFLLFQKFALGILVLFFSLMAWVVIASYARSSGSTGLDMSKIQKIRYETPTITKTS